MAKLFINEDLAEVYSSTYAARLLDIRSPLFNGTISSFGITIEPIGEDKKNPDYRIVINTDIGANNITFDAHSEDIIIFEDTEEAQNHYRLSILKGSNADIFGIIKYPHTFIDNGDTYVVLNDHLPPKKIVDADSKLYHSNDDPRVHSIDVGSLFILNGFDRFMLYEVTHINPGISTFDMILQEPFHFEGNMTRRVVSNEFISPYHTDKISYEKFLQSHYMTIENTCIVIDACGKAIRVWTNLDTASTKAYDIMIKCKDIAQQACVKGLSKYQLSDFTKASLVNAIDPDDLCRLEFVIFLFANSVVSIPMRFSKNSLIT